MGLLSLYGVWEREKFAESSIIESYEPDRTKVIVEFEADESELGVKTPEVGVETSEDIPGVAKKLGVSAISVWRAIRAMKEVGLLVREGGDKGGKWIVKK